jgi:type II secretory pathway pseudopilin PulG
VVVIGIIILLVAIAVPAVGPAIFTSQQTQVIQQLTGAINMAQIRAESQGGFAIRIERAFKTDQRGYMVDASNTPTTSNASLSGFEPVYLGYQQIRFLRPPREGQYYAPSVDDVIKLPTGVWVGPDYATNTTYFGVSHFTSSPTCTPTAGLAYNPFENFCVAFDQRGGVTELRPYTNSISPAPSVYTQSDNYRYQDQSQTVSSGVSPITDFAYNSARGFIMYDRKKFEAYGPTNTNAKGEFLGREGRTLYINRYLGTLVEGEK